MNDTTIKIVGNIPQKGTEGAAGYDLVSTQTVVLYARRQIKIDVGLSIELPPGYVAYVCPRSGLALKHKITVLNSPGAIDSDFRGRVQVILVNHSDDDYCVSVGDKIAQMIISKLPEIEFISVDLLTDTKRGEGGFGSTGK